MIFGKQNKKMLLKFIAAAVVIFSFALPSDAAEPWGLSQLMIDLGRVKEARATFIERKFLKVLNTPLESSGKLIYIAPFRLEKYTLAPKPESMVVEQDTLTLERGGRKRTLQIQDYPVLWAFVESIRGTLKGDLSALRQFYQVELSGTQQAWQLVSLFLIKRIDDIRTGKTSRDFFLCHPFPVTATFHITDIIFD